MKVVAVEMVVDKVEVQMIKVVRRRRNSAAPEHCETEEEAEKGATKI